MASAEEKLKGVSRDRQVMGSNANGAEGAEGEMEETNLSSRAEKCLPHIAVSTATSALWDREVKYHSTSQVVISRTLLSGSEKKSDH